MSLHNLFHDGKPQAGPLLFSRKKGLKNLFTFLFLDTTSAVGYIYHGLIFFIPCPYPYHFALRRSLDGIRY
jgi:hypothetical protein